MDNSFLFSEYFIRFIDPHQMRYNTVADWTITNTALTITLPLPARYEPEFCWLLVTHERAEAEWCLANGVSQDAVDKWDTNYENNRPSGISPCGCEITPDSEPGWDPHSPYHNGHKIGEALEAAMCVERGINWQDYMTWIDDLYDLVVTAREGEASENA